jgi:hypothetical protein
MAAGLSSRERMLAAINHVEPDYVPLWFNWHYKDTQILQWDDIVDRAERVLAMGLDDTIRIDVPESVHPETSTRVWVEHPADSRYPLIHKEYYTPKGAIHQARDKICFLGGLNAHATLINGSEDDIRREVRYARETLGPGGGLILSPIDNIYPYTPRRNLETLIDEWRQVRDYE